jgi:hypothetical protein
MFESWVTRRIFGPQRDEIIEDWRKLRNEEPHNSYSSPNIITMTKSRTRWTGPVARVGENISACRVSVGKPEDRQTTRKIYT